MVRKWLSSKDCDVDSIVSLPDLQVGCSVEARFHGGDEWYMARVEACNGEGAHRGTYKLSYLENGMVWGDFSACPREEIRMAGAKHGGETALVLAAENNAQDVAEVLVVHGGANVDLRRTNGDTALVAAATHSFADMVELLLRFQAKSDITNFEGNTALIMAAGEGGGGSVSGGGGVGADGSGAASDADGGRSSDEVRTVMALLRHGGEQKAFREHQNNAGTNAVIAAARANRAGCLNALLSAGLSPDQQTKDGDSAAMVAARFPRNLACARRLLAASADLELSNANGDSVLTLAARSGNTELVLALAEADAAPPARAVPDHANHNGDTALMLAVSMK